MGADGAIVCTDDAIAKDNTELVFDRDCHDIQRGYHLARARWCGSPGVARHSPSVVLMLGTRQSGQSRYGLVEILQLFEFTCTVETRVGATI